MEQHLHRQCSERLLCLSNYIYSKVLDNSQGQERSGEKRREGRKKGEEDKSRDARLKTKNVIMERKKGINNSYPYQHTCTHASDKIKAPWDTSSSHDKTTAFTFVTTHSLRKTQSVAYVAMRREAGRMALGDICVPSCLSQQHVSSAKYTPPDNKSARTLRATQICLQTKWRLTNTSRGRWQTTETDNAGAASTSFTCNPFGIYWWTKKLDSKIFEFAVF